MGRNPIADPTNEELAERLEAIAAVIGKEASLETTPADRVEELADDEWNIRLAAARLRQPLAFRWEGEDVRIGQLLIGHVFQSRPGRWAWGTILWPNPPLEERRCDTLIAAKAALEAHITAQVTGGGS